MILFKHELRQGRNTLLIWSGDKLEQLRKKLKELRNRLAQVMTGKQTGDKNEGLVKALNSQIREVATQIAELTAQAMQTKGK